MPWPDYFPEDCPPVDAIGAIGEMYIFVSNDKPIEESFLCKRKRFPDEEYFSPCIACGLSVAISKTQTQKTRKRVPTLRRKKICYANLEEEVGKIKHTPLPWIEHHYTWWIPRDVKCPWGYFTDIE